MKIGIFLGYGPQVKLGKEGLGRYMGGLIKGFIEQENEVTIACPFWLLDTVNDLLESFAINKQDIKIISTKDYPPLWKLYLYLTRKSRKGIVFKNMLSYIFKKIDNIFSHIVRSDSSLKFIFWGFYLVCCIVIGIIPSIIVMTIFVLKKIAMKILYYAHFLYKKFYSSKKGSMRENDILLQAFYQMTDSVLLKLISKVNSQSDVDVWFVPAIFWPQVSHITGNVVINAPDLVSQEFPHGFADVYGAPRAISDCRKTLLQGKYFITYCEFLKKELLVEQYGKPENNVVAIRHSNNDMYPYLDIDKTINDNIKRNVDWVDVLAHDIVGGYMGKNMKYIFYASQIRPCKNMLNLVKAYEYLLRKKFIQHKLVITADLNKVTEVSKYIHRHRLEDEVISVYNVPAQNLAALYYCADLVVNPTLYEGGFPFTFGEGMSVGTPSIMSDIPQVSEILNKANLEEIMFDPYDWRAIASKIEWALSDIDSLYQKELPLYETMKKRTYSEVANEYVVAFQNFIQQK